MAKQFTVGLVLSACTSIASAQSSVTAFGIADAAVSYGKGSTSHRLSLNSGSNMTSRIGFRGTESLGGGMSGGFHLEAQVGLDTGADLAISRRSTVSLFSSLGEVRLGRDFTAHYRNRVEVDPFGNAGIGNAQPFVGSIAGATSTRANNMVGYFLPTNSWGIYGQAQYYFGESTSNSLAPREGNGFTARVGYLKGPLNVSLARGRTELAATTTVGDTEANNLGVQYQIGPVRLMSGLYRDSVWRSNGQLKAKGWTAGALWTAGAGDVKLALSQYETSATGNPGTTKLAVGYVYNLSKRTALYGTMATVQNKGGASTVLNAATNAANKRSNGIDIGVRHQF